MSFFVVGCSHRTAPLALRERLAFPAAELTGALRQLSQLPGVSECLLLSTCNRVEVYGVASKVGHAMAAVSEFLASARGVDPAELEPALVRLQDLPAVRHVFSVTSSLEAIVVGEAQIAGQVKEAYSAAARARTVGSLLSRCMHRAFATAKRVRHETEIARHPVSVSSVAAELAGRVFGDLGSSTVLVIGAGEMAELAVRHLVSDGAADVRVVNRTYQRAVQLAFELGARAVKWEQLSGQLLLADIVISSTGSEQPILTRRLLSDTMRERKQRPLFIVDIAVPRDVEKAAGKLENLYLFDVDDLEGVVAENLKERRKEVRQAERILEEELAQFEGWLRVQEAVPVIKQLRERFSEVVRAEAEHTGQALHLQDPRQRQALEAMASAIVNKLLHHPTIELKRQASQPGGGLLARSVRELFHLSGRGGEGSAEELEAEIALEMGLLEPAAELPPAGESPPASPGNGSARSAGCAPLEATGQLAQPVAEASAGPLARGLADEEQEKR